jgi:hypothetical protein
VATVSASVPRRVIPTGAGRRFFPNFAPAKLSVCAAEESLFDLSRKPRRFHLKSPFAAELNNHFTQNNPIGSFRIAAAAREESAVQHATA